MTAIFSLRGIGKQYGGVRALQGIDLDVNQGEVLAIAAITVPGEIHADPDHVRCAAADDRHDFASRKQVRLQLTA